MKLLCILLLFILSSCSFGPIKPVEEPPVFALDVMQPVIVPSVVNLNTVKINVVSLTGFNTTQAERFKKIVKNCEVVINSKEYASGVLLFSYQDKQKFIDTTDSNEVILKKILSKDWELEYKLERLSAFSKSIGYTYPTVKWIALNSRKYPSLSDGDVCANIVHEYGGHKFGRYGHAMKWSEARDYSVPYGLGYLAEKVYVNMFKQSSIINLNAAVFVTR